MKYSFLTSEHNDVLLIENNEPINYRKVLNSSKIDKWLEAMESEIDSIYENQVWTLANALKKIKPTRYK